MKRIYYSLALFIALCASAVQLEAVRMDQISGPGRLYDASQQNQQTRENQQRKAVVAPEDPEEVYKRIYKDHD